MCIKYFGKILFFKQIPIYLNTKPILHAYTCHAPPNKANAY